MQKKTRLVLTSMLFALPLMSFAAKPLDLNKANLSVLHSFASPQVLAAAGSLQLVETSRNVVNQTTHVRVQEMYSGYPIVGADAVIHVPSTQVGKDLMSVAQTAAANQGSMDGVIFENIHADLAGTPATFFAPAQAHKALTTAIASVEHKLGGKVNATEQESKLVVYVDDANKAHWAYQVTFSVAPIKTGALPSKPVLIMDAKTLKVYRQYDNIKTRGKFDKVAAEGGGFGGNIKMGKMVYDGAKGDLASFGITREDKDTTCYLKNTDVTVKSIRDGQVESFQCAAVDEDHNNVYWSGEQDAVNDGYSPANDAAFGGMVIKNMYKDWYGVPVLTNDDGSDMMLTMVVHAQMDNAYWDGRQMTFGDGISMFYPLTSLGVAAHEISHGFTEQHSNLSYWGQSGGMNEAFSDMAAQGAEMYAYGKNSWQIGPEIFKQEDRALRYMDQPSKDCNGGSPGNWCSIDDASQYYDGLDVHFSSGVYNHFFYILGTSAGWDVKKAFDVMVHANSNYWTSSTNFKTGACGVIKAAKDLKFKVKAVKAAFKAVKVDTTNCA